MKIRQTYLKRLFQTATADDLKQICRDHTIKGFSTKKKSGLVELVLTSLSEEELKKVINKKEEKWISKGIDNAFNIINSPMASMFKTFRIVNEKAGELEMDFDWYREPSQAYVCITNKNINDPEFDCDCSLGSNGGFCGHFWLGFIFSFKKKWFDISKWTMMKLPQEFLRKIKTIEITKTKSGALLLIDKSSDSFLLQEYIDSTITVKNGKILGFDKKSYEYEGNITVYYLITLKDAIVGKRKVPELHIRLSEGLFTKNSLKIGDKIEVKGKLVKDKFQGLVVKFIRNVLTGKSKEDATKRQSVAFDPLLKTYIGKRVTIYKAEIENLEKKSYEFNEKIVEYYLATLKNIELGPQLKRKSDYRKEDIKTIKNLIARLSDTTCETLNLTIGDKIGLNGRIIEDSYVGIMIKRATKLTRID